MDLAGSTQWRLLVTSKTSMEGPLYKVHVWKGPCSDLIDRGHHGKVLPKTSQGPFFKNKNGHFCFPAGPSTCKRDSTKRCIYCKAQELCDDGKALYQPGHDSMRSEVDQKHRYHSRSNTRDAPRSSGPRQFSKISGPRCSFVQWRCDGQVGDPVTHRRVVSRHTVVTTVCAPVVTENILF